MTAAQMTDVEKRKNREEKLDLYQRAVDDVKNYCSLLNEQIEALETVVKLYRQSDLRVTGPATRRVLGADIILPSHDEIVSALESCQAAQQEAKTSRSAAARAGVDRKTLEEIRQAGFPSDTGRD
ncbi:MAG: hypothetical protein OXQ29_05300 [Rhodospirillaceae bacterium]|nr:hypothetical protein [Rhodospirillaceae bacterium]